MITMQQELEQALELLDRVYHVLAELRTEYSDASPSWRTVMAEGWIEQANQLQSEIEKFSKTR